MSSSFLGRAVGDLGDWTGAFAMSCIPSPFYCFILRPGFAKLLRRSGWTWSCAFPVSPSRVLGLQAYTCFLASNSFIQNKNLIVIHLSRGKILKIMHTEQPMWYQKTWLSSWINIQGHVKIETMVLGPKKNSKAEKSDTWFEG